MAAHLTPTPALVATLGPASFDKALDIAGAGATAFRLNGSHMHPADLARVVHHLRQAFEHQPIVVDLQGAKMRLGSFEARRIAPQETLFVALEPSPKEIPLPHPEIYRAMSSGLTLSVDDDRVRLRVKRVEPGRLEVVSLVDAQLRPRKGVNVVEHPVDLDDLTSLDKEHIERCGRYPHVSFACSFMRDGREAQWIRALAPDAAVVGKIERAEAIEALSSVAQAVDTLWICRGDLGAQLGLSSLARWVHGYAPGGIDKPTLMAGQVLEHLTHHPDPTRSEVCHMLDLLERGYAGIVLSDETAMGRDPVRATQVASELLRDFTSK